MKTRFSLRFRRQSVRCFYYSAPIILTLSLSAATNDLTSALQRGLFEEEANHNLEAAAAAYQAVSAQFDKDRKLAATAIFRLGEVYRKQGKTNEAVVQYERIVREFSDQETLATLSRQNLGSLKSPPRSPSGHIATLDEIRTQAELVLVRLAALESVPATNRVALLADDEVVQTYVKQQGIYAAELASLRQKYTEDHPLVKAARANADSTQAALVARINQIIEGYKKYLALLEKEIRRRETSGASGETETGLSSSATTTDDEEKEIRRIQAMIQNSPDLINAGQNPPIFSAVEAGYLRVVKFLLDQGAEVNARSAGATPLHTAAKQGQKAMAELLLSRGAQVNAQNTFGNDTIRGRTPLHEAAEEGFQAVTEVLLANQADVAARDAKGNTPLHRAASRSRANLVALLAPRMPDINAENDNGTTALGIAAARGSLESVRALLAAKADANAGKLDQPLLAAIGFRRGAELIELLLSSGADANTEGSGTSPGQELGVGSPYRSKPLALAAERGDPDMVKTLLQFKADPNVVDAAGRTPLSRAGANTNVVKLLLDAKADPNLGRADSPLVQAVRAEDLSLAEMLLRAGANPNLETECALYNLMPTPVVPVSPGGFIAPGSGGKRSLVATGQRGKRTPLQAAVLEDRAPMVKLLLQFKGDPRANDPDGVPLVLSALGNVEMLQALLEAGADANANDGKGRYLLTAAASMGNSAAVDLLLAHGAKTEVIGTLTRTPLLWAIESGSTNCVASLLAAGADVNAKDNNDRSPLHYATYDRRKLILRMLLARGANPNVRDSSGKTPLDLTKPQSGPPSASVVSFVPPPPDVEPGANLSELAELLRQHGALDELPFFDRIEVRRPGFSAVAFPIITNDWNEFSLLELLAQHYGFITTDRNAVWEVDQSVLLGNFWGKAGCQFPDLSRVVIRRPDRSGPRWTEIPLNAASLLDSGDCARDVKLQPGDIVEIPEADHPVNEKWAGLPELQLSNLLHCISRTVTISIKGTPTEIRLAPSFKLTNSFGSYGERKSDLTRGSFMLKSVLAQSRLLRASSDMSRVKVTRRTDGKPQEWVLNCGPGNDPDLWLRDGDLIEVPDKP